MLTLCGSCELVFRMVIYLTVTLANLTNFNKFCSVLIVNDFLHPTMIFKPRQCRINQCSGCTMGGAPTNCQFFTTLF